MRTGTADGPDARDAAVTVVIATYNSVDYLRVTVTSVLQQTLSAWELIIVEDGSTDPLYFRAALREPRLAKALVEATCLLQQRARDTTQRTTSCASTSPCCPAELRAPSRSRWVCDRSADRPTGSPRAGCSRSSGTQAPAGAARARFNDRTSDTTAPSPIGDGLAVSRARVARGAAALGPREQCTL